MWKLFSTFCFLVGGWCDWQIKTYFCLLSLWMLNVLFCCWQWQCFVYSCYFGLIVFFSINFGCFLFCFVFYFVFLLLFVLFCWWQWRRQQEDFPGSERSDLPPLWLSLGKNINWTDLCDLRRIYICLLSNKNFRNWFSSSQQPISFCLLPTFRFAMFESWRHKFIGIFSIKFPSPQEVF